MSFIQGRKGPNKIQGSHSKHTKPACLVEITKKQFTSAILMETWLIDKTSARCDLKTKSSQLSKCKPVRFEFVLPPFLHAKVRHIHFTIFAIVLLRHMEGSATQPHCSNTAMCLGALARRFCCKHRPTRLPCPCLHGGTVLCVP